MTALPRAVLTDLIGGLSGFSCFWDGDPEQFNDTYIKLNVMAYRSVGQDEIRRTYDPQKDEVQTVTCGLRYFTLSIKVISYNLDLPGTDVLENIRRRLRSGAAREIMESEGLAYTKCHPIVDLGAVADNRSVFASTMDVGFGFAVNEVDITPLGGGKYIVDAPTTGTVTNVDGTLLPPVTTT